MNRIQPIDDSNKTISSLAQQRIRSAILEGILPPGSRIDQNQLARDLNTSLVPVREALKKLEGEGFVQIIPRRGAFVTESSIEDMEDLYSTRCILEGQAALHAAAQLSDDDLAQLERLCGKMSRALERQHYDDFTQFNREFHFTIYATAGSKYLVRMITILWELAERYRYRNVFFKEQAQAIDAEHQAILAACQARDGGTLQHAIIAHIQHTLGGLRAFMEQNRPQ